MADSNGTTVAPPGQGPAPRFGLLDAIAAADNSFPGAGDHVMVNGVQYRPFICDPQSTTKALGCVADSTFLADTNKDDGGDRADLVRTLPFTVMTADNCSTLDFQNPDGSYEQRAQAKMDAVAPSEVEKEFYGGTAAQAAETAGLINWSTYTPQWLTGAATVVGPAAVPLKYGLGLLAEAVGDVSAGVPWYHLPRRAIHLAGNHAIWRTEGAVHYAWDDGPLIFGDGYDNHAGAGDGAVAGPGAVTPGAHQAWVFATSPVRAWVSDLLVLGDTESSAMVRTGGDFYNAMVVRLERAFLLDWDRCATFAVLVDLTAAT